MKNWLLTAVLPLFLFAGCVNYQYKGEKAPVDAEIKTVKVYTDSAKVPKKYKVLGTATVSGNYQNVSVDRLLEKLKREAQANGASAVLIVERQVVPLSMDDAEVPKQSNYNYDDSNQNWSDLGKEIDQNIGNISFKKQQESSATAPQSGFKRILRAQYLRYLPEGKAAAKGK